MVINRKLIPWIVAGVALVAILLIVLVMVTQAAPGRKPLSQISNLITNPGFENGLTGWTVGWDGIHEATTDEFVCGDYSDHVEAYDPQSGTDLTSDPFHFNGGNLCLSAWVRGTEITETSVMFILYPNQISIDYKNVTSNAWQWFGSCSIVEPGDYYVSFNIYNAAYIDGVWADVNVNHDECPLQHETPSLISYQGQVKLSDGSLFSGTGYFKFAIVDSAETFYWSNDGTDAITPTESVTLTVISGLFNALLGETNPITYGMFLDSDRWLRVWFDDGTHGVQLLEPDAHFTTAPFAFQAGYATTALNATNAMTATYATTADSATTALTAANATTATYATTALTATWATTATTALTATNATTATYATTALTATNATTATYATTALTATNATTATTALTATNATTATTALTATWATTATTALTATWATTATTALTATNGTKTVTLVSASGSITLGSNTLAYTKIGRVVHVTGYIEVATVSNPAGSLTLTGLPFTCASGAEFYSAISISAAGLAEQAITALQGYVQPATTTAQILQYVTGAEAWPASNVKAGSRFIFNITYFTET